MVVIGLNQARSAGNLAEQGGGPDHLREYRNHSDIDDHPSNPWFNTELELPTQPYSNSTRFECRSVYATSYCTAVYS